MSDNRLYYGIGDVSKMLGVKPSKLRFWENEFPESVPNKNSKGTRFYSKENIELLKRILYLTEECGYTLEGAREQIRSKSVEDDRREIARNLTEVRDFLLSLKEQL